MTNTATNTTTNLPLTSPTVSSYFKCTQLGNAERLVSICGSRIRYCNAWKTWLIWDGRLWRVDDTGEINRMAQRIVRQIAAEAKDVERSDLSETIRNHAHRSETKHALDSMVGIAQTLDDIPITPDRLDANPWLLNCQNGVLDLHEGTLIPHRDARGLLLTKMTPVNYVPGATCPRWLRFLDEIFDHDADLIDYVQRIIGYSLTGKVTEKALFLFYGDGNNGKTTLLETIRYLLGHYAGVVEIDSLMSRAQDSARERAVATLHAKRFVTASEAEYGQRLQESMIKRLTGMGRLVGRRLYAHPVEFDPEFKLFIDANHKPVIRGTDDAIWLRMRLIPFSVRIPDHEIDKDLMLTLRTELPGILNWAVEGCLKWQKDGLEAPKAVADASKAYREEMDMVAVFVEECCAKDDLNVVGATDLYLAFKAWSNLDGERNVIAQNVFGQRLKRLGYQTQRTSKGNQWKGLKLCSGSAPSQPVPAGASDAPLSAPPFQSSWDNLNFDDIDLGQAPI